jgi:GntR family transcriptional regulator
MKATVALGERPTAAVPLPLYVQLREILRARIQAGDPPVGGPFPSEAELCARYRVSRTVVRQALDDLVREGLLHKHKGRGTVVTSTSIEEQLGVLKSFTEEMQAQGRLPGARLLASYHGLPEPAAVAALGLQPGETAYVVERLRLADGVPIAWERTVWPEALARQLADADLDNAVFYRVLEESLGILLGMGEQTLTAVAAPGEIAGALGVATGSPLLCVERTTYGVNGRAVLWGRSLYRADCYHYRVRLQRQPSRLQLLPTTSPGGPSAAS